MLCEWFDSGASFIAISGDPTASDFPSGDALDGVCIPSALIAGPESGVVGDCWFVAKATD